MKAVLIAIVAMISMSSAARAERITLSCDDETRAGKATRALFYIDTELKTVKLQEDTSIMEFKDGAFDVAVKSGPMLMLQNYPKALEFVRIDQDTIVYGIEYQGRTLRYEIDRRTGLWSSNDPDFAPSECSVLSSKRQF